VDDSKILQAVRSLPITEWSYKSEFGVRHIGPMAQDFFAAFHVGEDDRHIATVDEDGVVIAATRALAAEVELLEQRRRRVEERLANAGVDRSAIRRLMETRLAQSASSN
jgi:hypothetical protein